MHIYMYMYAHITHTGTSTHTSTNTPLDILRKLSDMLTDYWVPLCLTRTIMLGVLAGSQQGQSQEPERPMQENQEQSELHRSAT